MGDTIEPKASDVQEAHCFCGAVSVKISGDPDSVSICHCSVCRRLSGAPFVVSALFANASVSVLSTDGGDAKLISLQSSPRVARRRCAQCGSPVLAELGGKTRAVPLALFGSLPPRQAWKPQHHLHYDSRIIDVEDNLVKYSDRARGPLFMK